MSSRSSNGSRVPRRSRAATMVGALAAALLLAACGSSSSAGGGGNGGGQQAAAASGNFPVQVTTASFPTSQTLAEHTNFVLTIRNTGNRTIPNLAVTVCPVTCHYPAPPGQGTSSAVFDTNLAQDSLDNPSPPDWIVERQPGPCDYSCRSGGGGAYATQNPDTWASGPLRPGASVTFDWHVTAVTPGRHIVAWQVAGDLVGNAKAVVSGGNIPRGTFTVQVANAPAQSYVNNAGQIVAGSNHAGG